MGLFSSSKSLTTNNYDYTPVTTDEGIGVAAENSAIGVNVTNTNTYTTTDAGSIAAALGLSETALKEAFGFGDKTVKKALKSVETSNATLNDGYSKLIDATADLFNRGESLIGQTQAAVADAYGQAQNDKAGTIDNRTLIALAAAAVVGLYLFNRKRA